MDEELDEIMEVGQLTIPEEDLELLYSSVELGMRLFQFSHSPASYAGVLLEEADDSFLVALPVTMVNEDGKNYLESAISTSNSTARLMKGSISVVTVLKDPVLTAYHTYLRQVAPEAIPGLIEALGIANTPADIETLTESEKKLEDALKNGGFITRGARTIH